MCPENSPSRVLLLEVPFLDRLGVLRCLDEIAPRRWGAQLSRFVVRRKLHTAFAVAREHRQIAEQNGVHRGSTRNLALWLELQAVTVDLVSVGLVRDVGSLCFSVAIADNESFDLCLV